MSKTILTFLGAVFIILGLLGLFQNPLFGVFEVGTMLAVVYLFSGVLAVTVAAGGERASRHISRIFFLLYLLIAIAGFASSDDSVFGLFAANTADNYLHLLVVLLFLAAGFASVGNTYTETRRSRLLHGMGRPLRA